MKRFWIINLLLFQLCWFSAALLGDNAALAMTLLIALHFLLSPTRKADAKLLLLMPIGIAVDKLQLEIGGFSTVDVGFPLWLALLWCIFIISFNHSLHWLTRQKSWVVVLFGAIGGASSYWAGIQFGVLQARWNELMLVGSLMLVWSLLMPLLITGYRLLQPRTLANTMR
ncbi:DUF2878 domain-containing protein [Shewanella algidipiscicola]|uniref:DUF2878 domain-containing protein n=1 Tax=Shewanella algidipiscicola TaxID=614070 RepID=UPI000D782463|nr:DUF2878 domain-containing protein [Shewanella algidipiscicola]